MNSQHPAQPSAKNHKQVTRLYLYSTIFFYKTLSVFPPPPPPPPIFEVIANQVFKCRKREF